MHGVLLSVTLQRSTELQELHGEWKIMILHGKKCYFLIIFLVSAALLFLFFFAVSHLPHLGGVLLSGVMIKGRRMSHNTRTSRVCQR